MHTTKPMGYQPSALSITTPLPAGDNGQQCSAKTLTKCPSQGHPRRDTGRGGGRGSLLQHDKGLYCPFLSISVSLIAIVQMYWKCRCFNRKWSAQTWTWENFFQKTKMNRRGKIKPFSNLATRIDPYDILGAYSFAFI